MMYLENMGPRQSIASELLDTIRFGDLDRIRGSGSYAKKSLDNGDAYVIPFGKSKEFYGAVLVHTPKSIEVKYIQNKKTRSVKFKRLYEVKQFFCKELVHGI